jgi:hypothetical protein
MVGEQLSVRAIILRVAIVIGRQLGSQAGERGGEGRHASKLLVLLLQGLCVHILCM